MASMTCWIVSTWMSRAGWNPRSPSPSGFRAGEDVALDQLEEDFVDEADRDFKLVRYLPGGQRGLRPGRILDHVLRDLEGKQCLEAAAGLKRVGFEFIGVHVLVGKGQLGAVEDDQPAQLEPDEEERKSGETAVDGIVFRGSDLKGDVPPLHDLKDGAGNDPGQQTRR